MRFVYLALLSIAPLYAGPISSIPTFPILEEPPSILLSAPSQPLQSLKSPQPLRSKLAELPERSLQPAQPSDIVILIPPETPPSAALPEIVSPRTLPIADSPARMPTPSIEISTMKRTAALVLGAFLSASAALPAADALEPTPRELQKSIDDLRGDLLSIRSTMESLKSRIEQKDVADKLREVGDRMASQMEEVNKKMLKMQKDLDDMKFDSKSSKISSSNRIDLTTPPQVMPTGRTASVRFKNDYIEEVTLVLNGSSYRLTPGNDVTFRIPAGKYSYRVLPLQDLVQNRSIEENETKQVRIHLD